MLDLRKLLLALAVVALVAIPASAQVVVQPQLSCFAQASAPLSIRAEGVTELVGDVIITCTGGTPAGVAENLRQVNIQVFTSPSINITSRILSGDFTESLLFIDEPAGADQTICGSASYPYSNPTDAPSTQPLVAGVCGAHWGVGNGLGTYDPDTAVYASTPPNYRGNTYQARRGAATNSLIWQGVPFDPPGTLSTRILRITNVRVNASQLGVPAGSQASVALTISTTPSGVTNPINVPISNPSPTVAIAQNSLTFSVSGFETCLQCEDANADFAEDPTDDLDDDNDCDGQFLELRFRELFPTAFKRRNTAQPTPAITGVDSPTPLDQNTLNLTYQTESGFMRTTANGTRWPLTLSSLGNTSTVAGTSVPTLGLANHGTRLIARFANIQNGVQIWVETHGEVLSDQSGDDDLQTGTAVLVNTDPNGAGPFSAIAGTGLDDESLAQVSIVGGTGQAVWEIMNTDTNAIEYVDVDVVFAWVANTTNNLPALGTSTVNGALAPLSTVATASASATIPRFVDNATSRNLLTINSCRSNLLFPFVSNLAGFDTGLAIANTTKDPFGTALQTGACTINFYGIVGNSKVCLSHPSPSITGGEHFVWSLANGGAVNATAGFQGYVIAQCDFQYAHGYAFISDLGAQRLAQGYLALVMDEGIASRTDSLSESLGH